MLPPQPPPPLVDPPREFGHAKRRAKEPLRDVASSGPPAKRRRTGGERRSGMRRQRQTARADPAKPLFGIPQTLPSALFATPPPRSSRRRLCFVDVGINNLGIAIFSRDARWREPSVESVDLVDLMALDRGLVPRYAASNETCDRLARFFVSKRDELDACEAVFIERQPLCGFKAIEQGIFSRFRDKAVLLSPNALQAHFGLSLRHGYDRDARKVAVVRMAQIFLKSHATRRAEECWRQLERKHDVADAIVMGMYVFERKRQEWQQLFGEFP
jgi:hypothetical protein